MTFSSIRRSWYSRFISLCLMVTFVTSMVISPRAQAGVTGLPQPGTMVDLSPAYVPLMITGLNMHPENPLLMDFIVSTGNSGLNAQQVKVQSDRLIKYFLACLTIPENNQWVNLSPYEKQRIVPEDLGQTVLGQDMLAQDYILKQLTASLIYPEKNLGKNFWDTVYAKARQMYGTSQVPVNTFNKVWILPQYAKVYEHNNTVFVVKSHLKVMLDEDYLALQKHGDALPSNLPNDTHSIGANIIRQIILPAIEKEVNTGKNFAQLRQIYNSMILAVWFKKNLKQALLNQVYTDKSKVNGVRVNDQAIKEKIYQQYIQAYKKGVFNYIKEEVNQVNQETIPRKYFSGGEAPFNAAMLVPATPDETESTVAEERSSGAAFFEVDGLTERALEGSGTPSSGNNESSVDHYNDGNPNFAMAISTLREKGVPEIVLQNIEQGVIVNEEHLQILGTLANIGERDLLAKWSAPGINDEQKRIFLDQMVTLDKNYSGGLRGYKDNARKLLQNSSQGKSAFEGFIPSVPQGDQFINIDDNYIEMENDGLKAFNKTAGVLVAGGLGERLGYKGIKAGIPLDLVTMRPYLQHYIETMLAFQEKSNRLNHENRRVPLVIMTSDDTHELTKELLDANHSFGMEGYSVNPTREQVLSGQVNQIIILKQGMVPSMVDNDAKFVLDDNDPYKLQTKPHGHGDVHMLIKQAGLDELWLKEGRTHTFFFQDTNGEVFNSVLVGLANSIRKKFALNFLTVPREAKEKAGAIVQMRNTDGRNQTFNVEYNELDPFLKSAGNPDGDVPDPQTGKSPYPGNMNVFIVENTIYHQQLEATGGIFGEFINPKYADEAKTKFKAPTRSETMMQDYAKSLPGDQVGFTNFDKRNVFSPVKNDIAGALNNVKVGNYPDSMATGEADYYKAERTRFSLAGVAVDITGQEKKSRGVPFNDGAKITFSPFFASTIQELKSKVQGGAISSRSVLSIDGEDVVLKNLHLDGTLLIKTAPGVHLTVNDLHVVNAGSEFVDLTEAELNGDVPQTLKMRGYKIIQNDAKIINIQEPGNYEIGFDGQLKKLDSAMSNQAAWQVEEKSAGSIRLLTVTREETQEDHEISLQPAEGSVFVTVDDGPVHSFPLNLLNSPLQPMINTILDTVLGNDRAMMINYQNPTSTDVLNVIKQPRLSKFGRSFIGSISGKLKDYLTYEPLEGRVGLRFNISTTFSSNKDEDNFNEFDRVFLAQLTAFLREKFPTKLTAITGPVFDREKGTAYAEIVLADRAAVAHLEVPTIVSPGGIDLNSRNLNMESSGQKINITFNPAMIAQFERGDFSGVKIKILDVVPINLMPFLGLKENEMVGVS